MSCTLKITATDGTFTLIPDNKVVLIGVTAPKQASPFQAGRINKVAYETTTTPVSVDPVPTFNGANALYEFGKFTDDGLFHATFTNRV